MKRQIKTGKILARDYGITLRTSEGKFFVSPSRYALARIYLESPGEIRTRIKDFAEQTEQDPSELEQRLSSAVQSRDGTKNILNFSGRETLRNVRNYAGGFRAEVKSKGQPNPKDGVPTFYSVGVRDAHDVSYSSGSCKCDDKDWNDVKKMDARCLHQATLETALATDARSAASATQNTTGLYPKERKGVSKLPFELEEAITQIMFDYYVEGKTHTEINAELLRNPAVYSAEVSQAMEHGKAQFEVLRQKEQTRTLEGQELRTAAAAKQLAMRLASYVQDQGFVKVGYSMLHQGTEHETVAVRFIKPQGYESMELGFQEGMPYLVHRNLRNKTEQWYDAREVIAHPFSMERYEGIDDATRRKSESRILLPGRDLEVFTPQILSSAYRAES